MGLQLKQPRGQLAQASGEAPFSCRSGAPLCALSFLEGPRTCRGQHAGEVGGGAIQRPFGDSWGQGPHRPLLPFPYWKGLRRWLGSA